jgi:aquaporin Z
MKPQALVVEIIGTFIFFSIILSAVAESSYGPIAIAVGLLAAIYFGGKISGGHYNPAVSIMMFFKGSLSLPTMIGYIIAQITGALLALLMNSYLIA